MVQYQDDQLRELVAQQAAEWYVAQVEEPLTPTQSRAFMAWLRASPIHAEEYLAIEERAAALGEVAHGCGASASELWNAPNVESIAPAVRHERPRSAGAAHRRLHALRKATVRPRRHSLAAGWAATVAAVAVVIAVVTFWSPTRTSTSFFETIATRTAQERTLTLPDKTTVQLDAASAITVRFDGARREVTVGRGQAYFHVLRDSGRPFSVRVGSVVIRDIGTEFNVSRSVAGTATVTVAEGSVAVWRRASSAAGSAMRPGASQRTGQAMHDGLVAKLGSGEQVRVTRSGRVLDRGSARLAQVLAWTRGRIVFDSTSVAAAVAELNRHNNEQIVLVGSRAGAIKVNGIIGSHDLPAFVAFLDRQPGVRTVKRGDRVVVYDESVRAASNVAGERRH